MKGSNCLGQLCWPDLGCNSQSYRKEGREGGTQEERKEDRKKGRKAVRKEGTKEEREGGRQKVREGDRTKGMKTGTKGGKQEGRQEGREEDRKGEKDDKDEVKKLKIVKHVQNHIMSLSHAICHNKSQNGMMHMQVQCSIT